MLNYSTSKFLNLLNHSKLAINLSRNSIFAKVRIPTGMPKKNTEYGIRNAGILNSEKIHYHYVE